MSKSVDTRVVEMEFDNQQFESGVATTMNTLTKFKEALKFDGAEKGLESIESAANSFNMDGIGEAVEQANSKFSLLEQIGIGALRRLGEMAMNTGVSIAKNLANSLVIEPVSQGWGEYNLKMESVQTIMAGSGRSMEEVNAQLEELNKYADQTIYSFSDMTSNIGKFTNAGVELEDAVAAIKGISNEAALSGANANEASRAMYNFAQALSAGYVKLIDWKSIENANMATKEFKEQLIETAFEIGTVVKEGDKFRSTTTNAQGSVSDLFDATSMFNDSLSYQWMTTDVLTKTLAKYADETSDIGKKAYAAATEVKTFSQMMDTIKEAVGSGWAQTFEYLVGNLEESKQLFTSLAVVLDDLFAKSGEVRNEILKMWSEMGGRAVLLEAATNLGRGILSIINPIREAVGSIFSFDSVGEAAEYVYWLSERFADLSSHLILSEATMTGLKNIVTGIIAPFKVLGALIGNLAYAFSPLLGMVGTLAATLIQISGSIGAAFTKIGDRFTKLISSSSVFENINRVLSITHRLLKYVISAGKTILSGVGRAIKDSGQLGKAVEFISGIWKKFTGLFSGGWIDKFDAWSYEFGINLAYAAQDVVKFIRSSETLKKVGEFFTPVNKKIVAFSEAVGKEFTLIKGHISKGIDWLKKYTENVDLLAKASEIIKQVRDWFSGLVDSVKTFVTGTEAFKKISAWLDPIKSQVKALVDEFGLFGTLGAGVGFVGLKIGEFATKLYNLVQNSGALTKITTWFNNAVTAAQGFGDKISNFLLPIIESAKTTFGDFFNKITSFDYSQVTKLFTFEGGQWDFSSAEAFFKSLSDYMKEFGSDFGAMVNPKEEGGGSMFGGFFKTVTEQIKKLVPEEGIFR